jgi:hypothetical protein
VINLRPYQSEALDAIGRYCMGDVDRTRAIHRKMMVAFGELEKPAEPAPSIDDDADFLAEVGHSEEGAR